MERRGDMEWTIESAVLSDDRYLLEVQLVSASGRRRKVTMDAWVLAEMALPVNEMEAGN
jgi:hypothetical protein